MEANKRAPGVDNGSCLDHLCLAVVSNSNSGQTQVDFERLNLRNNNSFAALFASLSSLNQTNKIWAKELLHNEQASLSCSVRPAGVILQTLDKASRQRLQGERETCLVKITNRDNGTPTAASIAQCLGLEFGATRTARLDMERERLRLQAASVVCFYFLSASGRLVGLVSHHPVGTGGGRLI